jgi:hypothetical protein
MLKVEFASTVFKINEYDNFGVAGIHDNSQSAIVLLLVSPVYKKTNI